MIQEGYKTNFETLKRAAAAGDLALVECRDKETGKPVIAVCAVSRIGDDYVFVPLAKMFDGNPYDELEPPTVPATDRTTAKRKRADGKTKSKP